MQVGWTVTLARNISVRSCWQAAAAESVISRPHSGVPRNPSRYRNPIPLGRGVSCQAGTLRSKFHEHPFLHTVEIPTEGEPSKLFPGGQEAWDAAFRDGHLHATVQPDLPPSGTFSGILQMSMEASLKSLSTWGRDHEAGDPEVTQRECISSNGETSPVPGMRIRTVAAQLRDPRTLSQLLMTRAADVGPDGALLLVSGGHPFRRLPPLPALVSLNSCQMLREAHALRKAGRLPPGVELWAVANPQVDSIDNLARKVDAGAEAIITQPPLLPDAFAGWWAAAEDRGLLAEVPVIVGMPFLTSTRNLMFWLELTRAQGLKEAKAVLHGFESTEIAARAEGAQAWAEVRLSASRARMQWCRSLPGIAGLHFMPVTTLGWRDMAHILDQMEVELPA